MPFAVIWKWRKDKQHRRQILIESSVDVLSAALQIYIKVATEVQLFVKLLSQLPQPLRNRVNPHCIFMQAQRLLQSSGKSFLQSNYKD